MRRIVLEKGQVFDEALLQRTSAFNADALIAATRIVETVKEQGDQALFTYTSDFDGVELSNLRVSEEAIADALARVDVVHSTHRQY